jgi:hypothetical protein
LHEATIKRIRASRKSGLDSARLLYLDRRFRIQKWHKIAIVDLIARDNALSASDFVALKDEMFAPDLTLICEVREFVSHYRDTTDYADLVNIVSPRLSEDLWWRSADGRQRLVFDFGESGRDRLRIAARP